MKVMWFLPSQKCRTEYTDALGRSRVCLRKDLPHMTELDQELRHSLASPHASPGSRWTVLASDRHVLIAWSSISDHRLQMHRERDGRVLLGMRMTKRKLVHCITSKQRETVDYLVKYGYRSDVKSSLVLAL